MCELEAQWRELWQDSACRSVFSAWDWAFEWWNHLGALSPARGNAYQLYVLSIYTHDAVLAAIFPFYYLNPHRFSRRHDPLSLRGIRLFGDGGDGEEDMTEEPIVVLRRGHERAALMAAMRHLKRDTTFGWDFINVRVPFTLESETAPGRDAAAADPLVRLRTNPGSQVLSLPDSWDAFRRGLGKSMRDNVSYYPRRLTRHGHEWTVRFADSPTAVTDAVESLVRLHRIRARGTRGVPHVNHLPTAAHHAFLLQALYRLASWGMAFVAELIVDGSVVASQVFLRDGETVVVYYSGFDPDWYEYSPVTILEVEVLKRCIEKKVSRVDFLPGEGAWKSRWGTREQPAMTEMVCLCPRPLSVARAFLTQMVRGARLGIMGSRPAPPPAAKPKRAFRFADYLNL